jgi:hypothetical protein
MMKPNFSHLADKWPSSLVARERIGDFTGGIWSPGYIANIDKTLGLTRLRVGGKVAYRVEEVIAALEARASVIDDRSAVEKLANGRVK